MSNFRFVQISLLKKALIRHSCAGGNPECRLKKAWIPAFAGMATR
jgi:hypothetical protein